MKKTLCKTTGGNAAHAEASSRHSVRCGRAKRFAPALLGSLLTIAMVAPGVSHAGTLYKDWNYAIDSFTDGSGGPDYEERGLAYRQIGKTGYFALSGGMPLTGVKSGVAANALNHSIAPGDLYLNFSSHALIGTADFNRPNEVFAIRFASANDSLGNTPSTPNTDRGLYTNLMVVDLASPYNFGYDTLQSYYAAGFGAPSNAMGDLNTTTDVKNYLGYGDMYPNIAAGAKLADISLLTAADLSAIGLDFAHFGANGPEVFGFSFDLSKLPIGNFTAHVFEECINDGIALKGSTVPEPGTLALLSLGLAAVHLRRR